MMRVNSIEDRNGHGLPVPALDFAAGQHVVTGPAAQAVGPFPAGAYQITTTAHIYLSAGDEPVAGASAGSTFIAAGSPFHLVLPRAASVSVISATSVAAHLFVVPLA